MPWWEWVDWGSKGLAGHWGDHFPVDRCRDVPTRAMAKGQDVLNANMALSLFPFIDQRKILQQGAIITQLLDLGHPRRHQTRKTQPMVWAHFLGKTIPLLKILIFIRRCAPCWQLYNCTVSVTRCCVLHKAWTREVYEKVRIDRISTVSSSFNDRENLENGILSRLKIQRPEYNDRCYFTAFWSSNHIDNFSGLNSCDLWLL